MFSSISISRQLDQFCEGLKQKTTPTLPREIQVWHSLPWQLEMGKNGRKIRHSGQKFCVDVQQTLVKYLTK